MFNIRATHQYGFRNGEWANVIGLLWKNDRPCYRVKFIDGKEDYWPVYDSSDPYEFRPLEGFSFSQHDDKGPEYPPDFSRRY